MAAEPIFVSPPQKTSVEEGQSPDTSETSLDRLPIARTVPIGSIQQPQPNGGNLPVFIRPPYPSKAEVTLPSEKDGESQHALQEQGVVKEAAGEKKTVAPAVVPVKPKVAEDSGLPDVEVPAAFVKPPDISVSEDIPETDTGIQLGLGLEPVKLRKHLPSQLELLQTKLANVVSTTGELPVKQGERRLCQDAKEIKTMVQTLSTTPLMEVTTHFTLWRSAIKKLHGSIDALQRSCGKPSEKSVAEFKSVVKNFSRLVDSR